MIAPGSEFVVVVPLDAHHQPLGAHVVSNEKKVHVGKTTEGSYLCSKGVQKDECVVGINGDDVADLSAPVMVEALESHLKKEDVKFAFKRPLNGMLPSSNNRINGDDNGSSSDISNGDNNNSRNSNDDENMPPAVFNSSSANAASSTDNTTLTTVDKKQLAALKKIKRQEHNLKRQADELKSKFGEDAENELECAPPERKPFIGAMDNMEKLFQADQIMIVLKWHLTVLLVTIVQQDTALQKHVKVLVVLLLLMESTVLLMTMADCIKTCH